jgi:homoserine kinase type II
VGIALAQIHLAAADFPPPAPTRWGCPLARSAGGLRRGWAGHHRPRCPRWGAGKASSPRWPDALPRSTVHADLFPDNVLMLGETVTGLIDFYFACTDIIAYDLAITHAAWCFSADGARFDAAPRRRCWPAMNRSAR